MENNEELIRLEEEQEKILKILNDLYVKRNMLEEELIETKNSIGKYKNIIQELEEKKLKLPKSLIKAIIISLVPIIVASLVSMGIGIIFNSIKDIVQMAIYSSYITALVFTPSSIFIGFKEYFDLKRILKNNNVNILKLLLEQEVKNKNMVIEENKKNNKVIKLNEEYKQRIESCIEEILRQNLSNEVIECDVDENIKGIQKIKK